MALPADEATTASEGKGLRMTTRPENGTKTAQRDPGRRDRLIDATIDVIAERGVSGATHRAVADAAGVPLGSTTYYFTSLEQLHAEAMARHAGNVVESFRSRLDQVTGRDQVLDTLVDLVLDEFISDTSSLVVTIELYGLATRKPAFREIMDNWVQVTRQVLEVHMGADAAQAVNAMIEGVVLHGVLSSTRITRTQLRRQLSHLIPPDIVAPKGTTAAEPLNQ